MKRLWSTCLTLSVAFCLSNHISARTLYLGAADGGSTSSDAQSGSRSAPSVLPALPGAAPFNDSGLIAVGTLGAAVGSLRAIGPRGGAYAAPWPQGNPYTFADVMTRDHETPLFSKVRNGNGNALTVAASPNTEPWLAALTGLGLVAVQLRRTHRLVQHRPLAK